MTARTFGFFRVRELSSLRVVRVVDLESLAPQRYEFKSRQAVWIHSCGKAIQLAYGMSEVLLRCPLVPEMIHRGASLSPPVKLGSRHITFIVLVQLKTSTVIVLLYLSRHVNFQMLPKFRYKLK